MIFFKIKNFITYLKKLIMLSTWIFDKSNYLHMKFINSLCISWSVLNLKYFSKFLDLKYSSTIIEFLSISTSVLVDFILSNFYLLSKAVLETLICFSNFFSIKWFPLYLNVLRCLVSSYSKIFKFSYYTDSTKVWVPYSLILLNLLKKILLKNIFVNFFKKN